MFRAIGSFKDVALLSACGYLGLLSTIHTHINITECHRMCFPTAYCMLIARGLVEAHPIIYEHPPRRLSRAQHQMVMLSMAANVISVKVPESLCPERG